MKLGLILSPGDTLAKQSQSGQLDRLRKYYFQPYSKSFAHIYLFTYGDSYQAYSLPWNLTLVPKPRFIPNYLYQLFLPFIHRKIVKNISVFRVFQTPGGLPALISKIFFNKPYIVTYGYNYVRFAEIENQVFLEKVFRLIVPLVLHFANKIIITFKSSLADPKIVIIHNGVDPRVFKPGRKSKKPHLILSVGRLVNQKNYERLIKTISLSRFRQQIRLVIIGVGPLRSKLLSLSQKLKVDLEIIPNVKHSLLAVWYQKASVFALTSRIEGQVKVLLEALSSGCACLTTPFIGNMIKHQSTGLIGKNSRQLSVQLDLLLSDPKLSQNLGRQARQFIIDNFDLKKLVNQEIKLLQSIANL